MAIRASAARPVQLQRQRQRSDPVTGVSSCFVIAVLLTSLAGGTTNRFVVAL
jgi:hypothetical protein